MRLRLSFGAGHLAAALFFAPFYFAAHAALPTNSNSTARVFSSDPTDAHVAEIEAEMLQTWHFSQHPFDQEIASKFLDRYLDTLDYSHLFFLKSDLNEFDRYRTNLQTLTMRDHDVNPCWKIFERFMQRVGEHTAYVTNLLQTEKFEFTGQDRYVVNRHTLPYPQNMDDAHTIWREELRAEYLQHLLSAPDIQFAGAASLGILPGMHLPDGVARDAGGNLYINGQVLSATTDKDKPDADVRYTGPARSDTNGETTIALARDKAHPLAFDALPKAFFTKDKHKIAWLEIAANSSNATVHVELPPAQLQTRATNHFFSASGEDLGDISFHRAKGETNSTGATAKSVSSPTNFEGIVHLNQKDLAGIKKTLTNHYVQLLKNYKELDRDRVFEIYMNSLARAYDPHSDYMGHMQAENFAIQMKLSLFGIGALLSSQDDYCTIAELKDGPAKKSNKINPGDRIVAVEQSNTPPVDVVGMPLDKVVELIRGPKGTEVTLTILPVDAADPSVRKDVTLVRDEIRLEDQAAKATLYETPGAGGAPLRLGVIDLASFYANNDAEDVASLEGGGGRGGATGAEPQSTSTDVARLIKRLKQEHVDGIILDLRRNGGGYLEEAIKLTGLFIPSGPVVQTKDPTGDTVTDRCLNHSVLYDGPLVVLTSRFSASASEIFAGALQDYNRALIVGDHSTFGKGTVQTMQPLKPFLDQRHLSYDYDPGDLKITIKKFYRASGISTQMRGVVSDIELPSILNYATDEAGESALPNALPCDEVSSADPENLNRVTPYLGELQQRSASRIARDKDFAYIQEDIAEFLKDQADKSISLNKDQRLAEQKERADRIDARKKERLARKKPDEKVYEITLKNVNLATLEPPPVKTNSVAAAEAPILDDDADADTFSGPVAVDPPMDESRRILADYAVLFNKGPRLTQTQAR